MKQSRPVLFFVMVLLFIGCKKNVTPEATGNNNTPSDSSHIITPGKVKSLTAYSGNGRIRLTWVLPDSSGSNVKEFRIYWSQKKDSMNVLNGGSSGKDTLSVVIDDLAEGDYTFTIYAYNAKGIHSEGAEIAGKVYGQQYSNSLTNRTVNDTTVTGRQLVLSWGTPEEGTVGEKISYTDLDGKDQTIFVSVSDNKTEMPDYPPGGTFTYHTLYLPAPNSIDTFYSKDKPVTMAKSLFDFELDKTKFKKIYLLTDTEMPFNADHALYSIWDGQWDGNHDFITRPGTGLPQWCTFDLGVKAKLSRYLYHQTEGRRNIGSSPPFSGGNLKKWELWGANSPNPNGSWDGWTLLVKCEITKPSGSGPGILTQEDIDSAAAGNEFVFSDTLPPVRYIRIKSIENWDTDNRGGYVDIGEVTFWATKIYK